MFKILHARLQYYVNQELPDVQAGLRKGRGTRDQTVNIHWIIEDAREFQKTIYLCFINTLKPMTVRIIPNCGKLLKIWEYHNPQHLFCLLRNLVAVQEATVRILYGTTDWFKTEEGVGQGCLLSSCLFNQYAEHIMKMLGWVSYRLESRQEGETSTTSDMWMIPL